MILDEKASISSFFVVLTVSFKSVRSTVWVVAAASLLMEGSAQQHASKQEILDPFKEADNSSILLSLIMLLIQLMDPSTWDPKAVESGMTSATQSLL